jgi:predicted hydrocarbon binding protein
MVKKAPPWLRGRILLRLARALVRSSYSGSRATSTMRGGTARIDLRASVFCTVRDRVPHPLCGFYAAAFTRLMALFDIGAAIEVVACRGTGEPSCVLNVSLVNGQSGQPATVEAL